MTDNNEIISESIRVFSAFCDETRLKVLEILKDGEKTAGALLEQVGVGQSTLSHHMKILADSGIVRARKDGKKIYYSLYGSGSRYAVGLLKQITNQSADDSTGLNQISDIIKIEGDSFNSKISMKGTFSIIVDTSCDLPIDFIAEHGIERIPIMFDLDDVSHSGGYWQDISSKDYYDALRNGGVAKTTQINPRTYIAIFKEYAKQGRDLLVITLSSGLSWTYQSSQIALKEIKENYPDCNIYTVDSISASAGIGLLAELAVKKRGEGLSAKETAEWLEKKKHSCFGLFTVDDLMYLHRGGRLGKLSAMAGSILKVKPLLNITPAGTLDLKDKVRGRKASLEMLTEQFKRSIKSDAVLDNVYIAHTDCEGEAYILAEMLKETVCIKNVTVLMMDPVIGAHTGPGALIVLFEADMTREEYENRYYYE